MDTILVRERYKVVQVLTVQENYAFVEAVDILDREKTSYLLNIYEGPLLRTYLPCFDQLKTCSDFEGTFLEGESLVAVFRYQAGPSIDQVFYQGDSHPWPERLEYAQQLMHQVLNMADLPAEVSCAALLSENVFVHEKSHEICLRFQVAPMEGMNQRETVYLACDQLRKILFPRFTAPKEQLDFLDELERKPCATIVSLYALWRVWSPRIQAAYEDLEKRNFFRRWCKLLLGHGKHWLSRRKRR